MKKSYHQYFIPLFYFFIVVNTHAFDSSVVLDDGTRHYFEDNYEHDAYEDLQPRFDQVNTYWPNELNESRYMDDGTVYIHNTEQDPPNTLWLNLYDSRSQTNYYSEIDILLVTGIWDDTKNLISEYRQTITREIKPGWNKIIVNMHHYKAQIVSISLVGLRTKSRATAIELKDKT